MNHNTSQRSILQQNITRMGAKHPNLIPVIHVNSPNQCCALRLKLIFFTALFVRWISMH